MLGGAVLRTHPGLNLDFHIYTTRQFGLYQRAGREVAAQAFFIDFC